MTLMAKDRAGGFINAGKTLGGDCIVVHTSMHPIVFTQGIQLERCRSTYYHNNNFEINKYSWMASSKCWAQFFGRS